MNEVEIPLKITGIGAMKAELRDLKGAIADATDPAQMAALSARAGELKDKISDANEAVNVFASGSKFEQMSNSLGGIKDSLLSLDFDEAKEKAQVFSQVMSKINPGDLVKGFKGFMGVIQMVGMQFVKLGIQILANPIFLLVAAITLIVVAIGVFLKKMGLLETALKITFMPILLIVEAFKALSDALGFTDTKAEEHSAALEEASEKSIKALEAEMNARRALFDQTKNLTNEELDMIEAQTGLTLDRYATAEDLAIEEERRKQAIREERIAAFEEESSLNEEEQKKYDDLVTAKAESVNKIIALEIQKVNNQKKLALDIDKQLATLSAKQIKNETERAKAMLDIQEKEALAKLATARREASRSGDVETVKKIDQLVLLTTQDFQRQRLEITNKGNAGVAKATTSSVSNTAKEVESAQDKHLKEMRIKHKKAVDDAKTAGKTQLEIAQLQIDQMIEERVEIEKLNLRKTKVFKNELERGAAVSDMNAKIKEATDKLEQDKIKIAEQDAISRIKTMILEEQDELKKLELQKTLLEEERKQKVASKELTEAQIKEINAQAVTDTKVITDQITALEQEKNLKILASAQLVQETKLSKEAFTLERFKGTTEQQIAAQEAFLTTTLATIDAQRVAELAAVNLSEAEKEAIKEKYRQAEIVAAENKANKIVEIEKAANEKIMNSVNEGFNTAKEAANAIASINQISTDRKLKNVEKGSKEEEKILRQQFEQQKAFNLAMAVINGAQSILAITSVPDFTLGIASGIRIAASVAATAASISAITSASFQGGGAAPSNPNIPDVSGVTATNMATPSTALFGSNNNLNNVGAPQEGQGGQNITVNAIVSETQVTEVQNRVNKIQRNAEL